MATISKITIDGFKAFPNSFTLDLDGKNLLMYGENGSGKSSIYYALHSLLQSQCKDKSNIYFSTTHSESIVNKHTNKQDAKVEIKFKGSDVTYSISKDGYKESIHQAISPLRDLNGQCVFINHKFLFNVFSFRNSQYIDLFPVFIKDILPFILTQDRSEYISMIYDEIMKGIKRHGRSNKIELSYQTRINKFNAETKYVIDQINSNAVEPATKIYNKYFRNPEDRQLRISLGYDDNRDNVPHPDKSYWLRCGLRYQYVEKAGVKEAKSISSSMEILQPSIMLHVEELQDDGSTYRPIEKPQTYFNEAKLTAIALSIRFALLDTVTAVNGRFLALDDMLISLDMSNRAKVVDFLLDISDKYKIYLFTHDKAFFEFVKHKSKRHIPASEWLYKEIYMGENNSPYIRDSNSYLGEAEHYINQHKFEIAGNFLRKEAEAFCKRFLPSQWQLTKEYTCLDLNGMIQNCKRYASESGISDLSLFDDLDDYRKFILNSSSHDSYDVVKFESEVRKCLETLKLLSNITSIPILKFGDKVRFVLKTPLPDSHEFAFDIQICDELRVIEIPGLPKVLSKVMINYKISKDKVVGKVKNSNQTLKKFYDYNYAESDRSENPNYLEGVKIVSTMLPLSSLL